MAEVERTPEDYADIQAALDEGDLDKAKELASARMSSLSGEDQTIVADLIAAAEEAAKDSKKAESKAEAKAEEPPKPASPSGSTGTGTTGTTGSSKK